MSPTSGQRSAAFAGAAGTPDDVPRLIRPGRSVGDRIYRGASMGGGLLTLLLLVLIGWFLLREGLPELRKDGWQFITGSQWTAVGPFGIWAVMYWTVVIAVRLSRSRSAPENSPHPQRARFGASLAADNSSARSMSSRPVFAV